MTRTVDVVVVGGNAAAFAATLNAIRRGLRVLVVIRARRSSIARHLRRAIGAGGVLSPQQLTVLTGAEVACVDGVKSIEAVVVRQLRTRRLIGVNASALIALGKPSARPFTAVELRERGEPALPWTPHADVGRVGVT